MEYTWNLDKLYFSFEDENFINDCTNLSLELDKFIKWTEFNITVLNSKNLEFFLKKTTEIKKLFEKIMSFGQLSFSVNVKNESAKKVIEFCENLYVKFTEVDVLFSEALKNTDNLDVFFKTSDYLKEHEFYINEIKENTKYLLSKKEELILEQMKNIGSRSWSKLQENLTATLNIEIEIDNNKEILPLSSIRNLAYNENSAIRKNAYYAELKSYERIEEAISFALNSIKGEAIQESKIRGYNSVLEKTLKDSRIKRETLDSMLESIRESLPYFTKFFKKKSEILNYKNGLPFYELFAPIGEVNLTFTEEEAKNFILKNFYDFSDSLGNFAKKAFLENWIDFNPREGKVGGAFCYNIQSIGESRILSNFTGSFSDVITLAHELGHAYHGYILNDESYLNTNYTMPIAETASIFCETIIKNAIIKNATVKEKLFILEQDISDSLQVIVDIYSRFLFETNLINKRENESLSVEELKNLMINAQKESYKDGLDWDFLHPYMWICKSHYYEASLNFYNFPYAFGLLFSKGLYSIYLKNSTSFIEKYNKLLSITGKTTIEESVNFMNIDISNKNFWKNSLELIKNDIDTFIKISEN